MRPNSRYLVTLIADTLWGWARAGDATVDDLLAVARAHNAAIGWVYTTRHGAYVVKATDRQLARAVNEAGTFLRDDERRT